jgi:hypothetical protein
MADMGDAAGQIALALMGRLLPPAGNVQRYAAGGVIIAILLITGYIGLVLAAWFAVSAAYGPVMAGIAITAASLILALIVWGVTTLLNRRAQLRRAERARLQAAAATPEMQLAEAAFQALPGLMRDKPFLTMACVAGAVFAMTRLK